MTNYHNLPREELIQEIKIWQGRAAHGAESYLAKASEDLREEYQKARDEYTRRAERYDWIISLLSKFGIKEKPNDQ
jgi:hypothetical protein